MEFEAARLAIGRCLLESTSSTMKCQNPAHHQRACAAVLRSSTLLTDMWTHSDHVALQHPILGSGTIIQAETLTRGLCS